MEQNNNEQHSEIDLLDLTINIFKDWKALCICVAVGGILGIVVALVKPKEYTASVVLAPEMSSGGLGMSSNLADMAASFGFDLGSKSQMDAIYPEIYPDIFASTDFVRALFDVPVRLVDDNETRTYLTHITKEKRLPFWKYPKAWLIKMLQRPEKVATGGASDFVDPFRMPRVKWELCEGIKENIICTIDKKTSEITISFRDQDPMVAAIMADTLQHRLQNYITDYRTQKAHMDYDFYTQMAQEALVGYEQAQQEYTTFADGHRSSNSASVSARLQVLLNKMNEAYSLYSGMEKMRTQAYTKIQERTPAYTTIQSAIMPHKASSKPRSLIVLIFAFLGGVVHACRVLYNQVKDHQ